MRILVLLRPNLQIASQCALDSGEAAGEVSSMYSTPKASRLYRQHRRDNDGIDLRLGNLDLGLQSEESIGELFSLYSSAMEHRYDIFS